jgi:uncharacterized metal-binding protein YceD (DUF177 family)
MSGPAPEFSRPLPADRIGPTPVEERVAATAQECAALALRLAIPAVLSLTCSFRLQRREAGRIAAEGRLQARLVRESVISLEPFETDVAELFRIVFVPAGQESGELDLEADDEVPYGGGAIDLGEAAAEQLALTLDPYPRRPGEELPAEASDVPLSPFAVLVKRRRDGE